MHVRALDVRCVDRDWTWARENRAQIEAFWNAARAEQPKLFDGRVFVFADIRIEGDTLHAVCFETNFSNLLYAKRNAFPDPEVVNGFAMGALRTSDDAYLLGVMGSHTANRGQIYFPAGTPDPSDRREDGMLDLLGSIVRELKEETGISPGEYQIEEGWILVRDGGRLAFLRPVRFAEPADRVCARMVERMKTLADQELADIYVARDARDIEEARMPRFIRAFLRWSFGEATEVSGSRSAASSR
jgi:8-oxo-dGTP pyrophosphatase MutT (NUDIX family)